MAARKLMFNGLPMPTPEELFGLFFGEATRDMTTGEITWLNQTEQDDNSAAEPVQDAGERASGLPEPRPEEVPAGRLSATAPSDEPKPAAKPLPVSAANSVPAAQPRRERKDPKRTYLNGLLQPTPEEVMALALGEATRDMSTGEVIWLNRPNRNDNHAPKLAQETEQYASEPPQSQPEPDSAQEETPPEPIHDAAACSITELEGQQQEESCHTSLSPEASLEDVVNSVHADAGFAGPEQLPEALTALGASDAIVLDFETTGLTAYETPQAPSATQTIGGNTIKALRAAGCTLDPHPRARILSLQVPDTGYRIAFDLDQLSDAEKRTLAKVTHDKIWIGHNLGFDLAWMLSLHPGIRPKRILDTMLLATTHRPQALYEMQSALVRNQKDQPAIREALWNYVQGKMAKKKEDDESGGALSLQALSLQYLDESLDKAYQKPHNWMIDRLSKAHWDYCMGDVDTPLRIARKLLDLPDDACVPAILQALEKNPGATAYRIMEAALPVIARMHHTGVPWSAERAAALDTELAQEAQEAAAELLKLAPKLGQPILVPGKPSKKTPDPEPNRIVVIDELLSPSKGLTAPIKSALAAAIAEETGRLLQPDSPSGESDLDNAEKETDIKLDAKRLAFDFPDSKVVRLLGTIQGAVKERAMIAAFAAHAEASPDGRIHPLTGISTVTGRTSATNPSLQQVPRDKRFRAIFAARPGYQIVATDFSSIELRIAAALGVRAWEALLRIEDILRRGRDSPYAKQRGMLKKRIGWILGKCPELVEYLKSADESPPASLLDVEAPNFGESSIEDYARHAASELVKWVSRLRRATGGDPQRLPFVSAYRRGIDPHLLTAVAMKSQAGEFNTAGKTALEFLAALSPEDASALTERLHDARQAAKAVNFGSLYGQQPVGLHRYGVTAYGLSWTLAEAEQAHAAWFQLYPEIGLWHWLLRRFYVHKKRPILNPYNPIEIDLQGKIYRWSTLSGRIVQSSRITSAANYQDQGSGAEIALLAIASLPEEIQTMLINFVHDELVLEVPEKQVPEVIPIVEQTMIQAAERFLLPYGVPVEVKTQVGDSWKH
ncbi:DNA polymerase [Acidithiobacillus sp. YTS05]|nr:DNA polymerase [Acidithiobacillus sp. YTS05]